MRATCDRFTTMAVRAWAALGISWTLAGASPVFAQIPLRRIAQAETEFSEPFSRVAGLRALRDGRVIVADSREGTLQVIDFTRRTSKPVGRRGAGPAEWGTPGMLLIAGGDTTIMPDFSNWRLFVVRPDGTPGPTVPLPEDSRLMMGEIAGASRDGRVLVLRSRAGAKPTDPSTGIVDVLRIDRASYRAESLGTLNTPRGERDGVMGLPGGMLRFFTNLPLAPRDAAVMAPDGRVAIVRTAPYRIEWIGTDGKRVVGPPAQAPDIPVTEAEKEAFVRSSIRPGSLIIRGGAEPSARPKESARRLSSAEIKALTNPDMTWPARKPPFVEGAAHIAPNGDVWVLRARAHDDPTPVFDVFDTAGRVREQVALPRRARLVGFGTGAVYLVRQDDDDLEWLGRYRL